MSKILKNYRMREKRPGLLSEDQRKTKDLSDLQDNFADYDMICKSYVVCIELSRIKLK